jgi:hypothetical protein
MWRPRHMPYISFRYAVNGPTKPQEALTNHEAEYFRQSQASLFWPITAAAIAYKKGTRRQFGHLTKVPVYSRAFRSRDYATLGSNPRKPSNQSMPSHISVVNKVKPPVFPSVVLNYDVKQLA